MGTIGGCLKIAFGVTVMLTLPAGCPSFSQNAGPYHPAAETARNPLEAPRLTQEAVSAIDTDPAKAERLLRDALSADLYHGPAHNNLGVISRTGRPVLGGLGVREGPDASETARFYLVQTDGHAERARAALQVRSSRNTLPPTSESDTLAPGYATSRITRNHPCRPSSELSRTQATSTGPAKSTGTNMFAPIP